VIDDPTIPDASIRTDREKKAHSSSVPDIDGLSAKDLPVVIGRYEIQGILGEGGMARVFRAELHGPAGFRKPVAVKFIKTEVGTNASRQEVRSLIQEACLGGRLKHPNIVDVYELDEVGGNLFISMELVEGVTLRQVIQTRQVIPGAVVMEIAVAIASGLTKAHGARSTARSMGLVHCDLKPSNLLLSWDGAIKIADFGISRPGLDGDALPLLGKASEVRGTPSYMSPEHLKGETLDGRSDLFSLALVIAEMVLGRNPFGGGVMKAYLDAAEPRRAPILELPAASLNQAVPGLGEVLHRCLALERQERYPSAAVLLKDLQGLQDAVGYHPRLGTWLPKSMGHREEAAHMELHTAPIADQRPLAEAETLIHFADLQRSNLAPPVDAFVGRKADLAELAQTFGAGTSLVTVKGTGGAGKTRLSYQYALDARDGLPGGAWLADLTEARSLMGILHAVAGVLDMPLTGAEEPVELSRRVGQTIGSHGEMLLILDNFEQVVAHAPATVGMWMALAPDAQFLVTSRESLRLAGEMIYPLAPLPPEDGLALFEARASSAGAQLEKNTKTRETIEEIVTRLDGLPLAIELAAARARMMSPEQILKRLAQRFQLLGGARRGDTARQSTLRGLIDWSWDLLEPWEKSALAQVSVFRDGFFMEAAEAVVDLSAWPEAPWTLDVVGSLLDKSLLHRRQFLGQPRFEMYVSIQEYAAEKLVQGDEGHPPASVQRAQRRHAAWYGRMGAHEYASALDFGNRSQGWAELFCELENLIAGTMHGTPETSAQCCLAAVGVVGLKGPVSLGVDLVSRVLERPGVPRHLQVRLEIGHSRCLRLGGRMKEATAAVRSAAQDEDTARVDVPNETRQSGHKDSTETERPEPEGRLVESDAERGEEKELAILEGDRLVEQGHIQTQQSDYANAQQSYEAALELFRLHRHRLGEGLALAGLGTVRTQKGRLDEATDHFLLALEIYRELGNRRHQGGVLGNLASLCRLQGRFNESEAHFLSALEIFREEGNRREEGILLGNLGILYDQMGRHEQAMENCRLAIKIHQEVGNKVELAITLGNLGDIFLERELFEEAGEHLSKAVQAADEIGFGPAAGAFRGSLALVFAIQGQREEAHRLLETGEPQVAVYPLEHSKLLCKKARVLILEGAPDAARVVLAEARDKVEDIDVETHGELSVAIGEVEHLLDGDGSQAHAPASDPASQRIDEDMLKILEGDRLVELGILEFQQGKYEAASQTYRNGLEIFRSHGHRHGEGRSLNGLGNVCQEQGRHDEAAVHFQQSLEILREVGDRRREGVVLGNLGNLHRAQGKLEEAFEHFLQSLEILREVGDKRMEATVHGNIGMIYYLQGTFNEAAVYFQRAFELHRTIGNNRDIGIALGNLGEALIHLGRLDDAEQAFVDGIAACQDTGFAPAAGAFCGSLALLLASQGRVEEAHALLETGESKVEIFPEEHVKFLCKKGQVQCLEGQLSAAQASIAQAESIASTLEFGEHSEIARDIAKLQGMLGE